MIGRRTYLLAFLVAWFMMASTSGATSSGTALYNDGNAHYRKGAYQEAIARYMAAMETGIQSPDLYYNLGNAYYKAGSVGLALLNYERGLKLSPRDPDILQNIAFANARKTDRFDEDAPNVLTRLALAVYGALSPNTLSIGVSVTFILASLCAGFALFKDRKTRWNVTACGLLLVCGASAALLSAKSADLNEVAGIVLAEESVGRSGPGNDFLQVFTLHEGTKVVIQREEGSWGLVRLPNGIGGWIPLKVIGMI